MKKIIYLCLLIALIINLTACINEIENEATNSPLEIDDSSAVINISTDYKIRADGYITNYLDTISVLIEDEENYKIYTDEGRISYKFEVYGLVNNC